MRVEIVDVNDLLSDLYTRAASSKGGEIASGRLNGPMNRGSQKVRNLDTIFDSA